MAFTANVFLGAIANILGVVSLILGLISFGIGWGFWTGKGWAWSLGMLFAIVAILTSLLLLTKGIAFSIVGLALNALMVYYLTRPHVKAFFGKEPPETMPTGQTS